MDGRFAGGQQIAFGFELRTTETRTDRRVLLQITRRPGK